MSDPIPVGYLGGKYHPKLSVEGRARQLLKSMLYRNQDKLPSILDPDVSKLIPGMNEWFKECSLAIDGHSDYFELNDLAMILKMQNHPSVSIIGQMVSMLSEELILRGEKL